MDARLSWAVSNNVRWCDLVCRSQGIETRRDPGLWSTAQPAPRFYPDAMTLQDRLAEQHVLNAVVPRPGASVKDSYATLDLGRHGFEELFEARWIWRDPDPARSPALLWTVVETGDGLTEWATAAGLTGVLGPELLHRPDVRFLAARDDRGIGAGAVANLTGPVVGISNVFTTTISDEETWASLPAAVEVVFARAALVGYEQELGMRAATAAGFRDLGPLRVWLAPRTPR